MIDALFCIAFVVGLSNKGKKISLLPPRNNSTSEGRQALEEDARKWLLRLAGGEVSQKPTVPGLFSHGTDISELLVQELVKRFLSWPSDRFDRCIGFLMFLPDWICYMAISTRK